MKNFLSLSVAFLFALSLNAQSFKYDKTIKNVDMIHISSLKKRVLGTESTEVFFAHKDSIMSKYNGRAVGDETVFYEIGRTRQLDDQRLSLAERTQSYMSFYVYDYEVTGTLNTNFQLSDGTYTFEFYLNNRIVKTYIATIKNGKIVNRINNTSKFDYYNNPDRE